MSDVLNVKTDNFEEEVLKSELPVLVDFWAAWCAPCRMVAPVVEEIAVENEGKLKVCKLDIDEEGAMATKYGVMSIPTLMMFKGGKPVETIIGAQPKASIEKLVQKYI